jgi:hypothetical protein
MLSDGGGDIRTVVYFAELRKNEISFGLLHEKFALHKFLATVGPEV